MTANKLPGFLIIAAFAILASAPWTTRVQAQPSNKTEPDVPAPLGRLCIVSVVTFTDPAQIAAGSVTSTSKSTVPSVAEGILIRMDPEWIVLRDGKSDHWISTSKATIMTVSQ